MFPSIRTKNPSPHTIFIALDRFLSRSFQFSFFNCFNPEWAKVFQLWFCALNYSWPSINFHAAFFPSLKLHSLWQAINGHSDTLVTQKECGNIVSRLRDLSSVCPLDLAIHCTTNASKSGFKASGHQKLGKVPWKTKTASGIYCKGFFPPTSPRGSFNQDDSYVTAEAGWGLAIRQKQLD